MQFNILSLQKVLAADYIYTFNLIPGKAVVQKKLPTGAMDQVALFSKSKEGRLTLDCTMTTLLPVLPSTSQAEVFVNTLSYEKKKVYDVAAPQFGDEVDPGWWRVSEPKEELLSSPTYVPPPAVSSATISEVIDANSEQDNTDEAKSAPPAPGPAAADAPAAASLDDMEEEDEDDHAIPAVPEVLLRRSEISSLEETNSSPSSTGLQPSRLSPINGSSRRSVASPELWRNTRRRS